MPARITNEQRRYTVKQLTLGATYAQIQEKFAKKFNRKINARTIARIRMTNLSAITGAQNAIASDGAASATILKQKSYQLLEERLDAAIEDSAEIRKLRKQVQSGELSEAQFKNKMALYEQLTITELTKVSDAMHGQSKGEKDDPVTPQDQAALAALIAGIQAGNPVQLIQVLNQSAGSPVA